MSFVCAKPILINTWVWWGVLLATIGRLTMSLTLHMWFGYDQVADDWLLMSQSLPDYAQAKNHYRLAKNQSFSMWLSIIYETGINVDVMFYLLWLLASCLFAVALYRMFRRQWLSIAAYLYVLWNPIAFENWQGTRVYRNSIFAPCMFILLSLLILYLKSCHVSGGRLQVRFKSLTSKTIVHKLSRKNMVSFWLIGIALGLVFAFIYDLKEDSAWLIPMFLFIIGIKIVDVITLDARAAVRIITVLIALTPIVTTFCSVQVIKFQNYRRFGVYELNVRTEGELAGFVERIYRIASPNQNTTIWTPYDSIERAFAVSPTLKMYPELLRYIEHEDFAYPNIHERPLRGEFLQWQLLSAVGATKNMGDESNVQSIFRRVNQEIDLAFADGRLPRTRKVSISKSLVPRSPTQLMSLIVPAIRSYADVWFLLSYRDTRNNNMEQSKDAKQSRNAQTKLHEHYIIGLKRLHINIDDPTASAVSGFTSKEAVSIARVLLWFYRIVMFVALIGCCIVIVGSYRRFRSRSFDSNGFEVGLMLCLFVYAFIYVFATCWYAEYLDNPYIVFFNTAGMTMPLVATGLFLALGIITGRFDVFRGRSEICRGMRSRYGRDTYHG